MMNNSRYDTVAGRTTLFLYFLHEEIAKKLMPIKINNLRNLPELSFQFNHNRTVIIPNHKDLVSLWLKGAKFEMSEHEEEVRNCPKLLKVGGAVWMKTFCANETLLETTYFIKKYSKQVVLGNFDQASVEIHSDGDAHCNIDSLDAFKLFEVNL